MASIGKSECHECGMIPFSIFDVVYWIYDLTNLVYFQFVYFALGVIGLTG